MTESSNDNWVLIMASVLIPWVATGCIVSIVGITTFFFLPAIAFLFLSAFLLSVFGMPMTPEELEDSDVTESQDRWMARFAAASIILATVLGIGFGISSPARADVDGHPGQHPIYCNDVEIPEGATCTEPEVREGFSHPTCEIVHPGQGSAAGRVEVVPCLPSTGTDTGAAAFVAVFSLVVGAVFVAFSGGRE